MQGGGLSSYQGESVGRLTRRRPRRPEPSAVPVGAGQLLRRLGRSHAWLQGASLDRVTAGDGLQIGQGLLAQAALVGLGAV